MKSIKCWECGAPATKSRALGNQMMSIWEERHKNSQGPIATRRCYCDSCFEKKAEEIKAENEQWIRMKQKRMFENAIDKLERQELIFSEYEEAIRAVEEYNMENLDKFDSAAEIITAIILIQNHVRVKPQCKIDKYQVDFLLPDDHIVLEIDGTIHKSKRAKDALRDETIRFHLGGDWQIVRIPAEGVEKNAKQLMNAIESVLDRRYKKAEAWNNYQ